MMPHRKNRAKTVDLAVSENEVSQEFAEELADGGERDVLIKKQQKNNQKRK
ncbi:hypothetical protein [Desertibacillus haloalkaliphilus]|uniref:hypothetical protein n=1 Tax=Desertibacillus haloalkaliphilus TaxID=1328930 RepID=UPI001C26CE82|nr:hypothetical protein [Desertibacillus haloalkaliphilus]MBU8907894.1 hypothetical protein [Desertibacillus haloalkaliphilus]